MRKQCLVAVCTTSALSLGAPSPAAAQTAPASTVHQPVSFDLAALRSVATEDTNATASATGSQRFQSSPNDAAALRMNRIRSEARKWEFVYLTLSAIDAAQTIHCLNKGKCEEASPIFGKNPSTETIVAAKLGVGLAHYALFNYLNKRDPRTARLLGQLSAGMQGGVVMWNASVIF